MQPARVPSLLPAAPPRSLQQQRGLPLPSVGLTPHLCNQPTQRRRHRPPHPTPTRLEWMRGGGGRAAALHAHAAALALALAPATGLDNGVADRPRMGWS